MGGVKQNLLERQQMEQARQSRQQFKSKQSQKDDDKQFNPLSVNFRRLQNYNSELLPTLEHRVLFEYLIMLCGQYNQLDINKSNQEIEEDTTIKKSTQKKVFDHFERDLGIIARYTGGFFNKRHFVLDSEKILDLLPKIYLKDQENTKAFFDRLLIRNQPTSFPKTANYKRNY